MIKKPMVDFNDTAVMKLMEEKKILNFKEFVRQKY